MRVGENAPIETNAFDYSVLTRVNVLTPVSIFIARGNAQALRRRNARYEYGA
jgi:hypothetical protein